MDTDDPAGSAVTAEEALERLGALRAETRQQLAVLTEDVDAIAAAAAGSNIDDEHDPEGATIAFEREQLAALRDRAARQLAEVDAAVRRVEEGSYGRCEICGRPIGAARLEALPATPRCVTCASRRAHRPS